MILHKILDFISPLCINQDSSGFQFGKKNHFLNFFKTNRPTPNNYSTLRLPSRMESKIIPTLLKITSGAKYSGVPQRVQVLPRILFAKLKSII